MTHYFKGRHLLGIGDPYAILSVKESDEAFETELLCFLDSYDRLSLTGPKYFTYPKNSIDGNIDNVIASELNRAKNFIFNEILDKCFRKKLERIKMTRLQLNETTIDTLRPLWFNHILELETITRNIKNQPLRDMIEINQKVGYY